MEVGGDGKTPSPVQVARQSDAATSDVSMREMSLAPEEGDAKVTVVAATTTADAPAPMSSPPGRNSPISEPMPEPMPMPMPIPEPVPEPKVDELQQQCSPPPQPRLGLTRLPPHRLLLRLPIHLLQPPVPVPVSVPPP
jgi:hypothetical protein